MSDSEVNQRDHLIPLVWFVQGHRFDILEDVGCLYAVPSTLLSLFLTDLWPVVIGIVSMGYSGWFIEIPSTQLTVP